MKTKHLFTAIVLVFAINSMGYGQSKRVIREKGIESLTVEEYFLDSHSSKPVVELIEKFNEMGDVIERKVFNSSGDVKKWEKYSYDEEGNLVEEIFFDWKGRIDRIEKSVYKDGLRIEKHFFNSKEKLYKKKVYIYEFRD